MSKISSSGGLSISVEGGIQIIKFDNLKVKNAISTEAYKLIKNALNDASKDDNITLTVLTGTGNYYSSGFNITASADFDKGFDESHIRKNVDDLR